MKFKHSNEVIQLIEKKKRNGIALRKFKQFMESMGNPQRLLKTIHVGGTNGKGSTTNAIATILIEAGYKVGSFTSPYLETHHDRIRINGVYISDEKIVTYANQFYDEWVLYDLSMFEIDMFIATYYFLAEEVDFAIFEVGLGGTQDATNILEPLVSVITNIGLDHMEYLGNSYKEIACAKAGIIKSNGVLITSEKKGNCLQIFKEVCKEKHSLFIQCEEIKNIYVRDQLYFDYKGYSIKQQSLASYQALNTALAIEVIDYIKKHHAVKVSDEQMLLGISYTKWEGRFEVLGYDPLIIIDGAHNNEGIEALVSSCKPFDNMRVLFSALKDKPFKSMLNKLLKLSDDVTVCTFPFERAAKAEVIAEGFDVRVISDYKEALNELLKKKQPLLICGSLYFISMVRAYLKTK